MHAMLSSFGSKHSPFAMQHASGRSQGSPLQYVVPGGGIGVPPLPPLGFELPPNDAPLAPVPAEAPALPLDPELLDPELPPLSSPPDSRLLDEPPQPTNAAITNHASAVRRTPITPDPVMTRFYHDSSALAAPCYERPRGAS